VLRALTTLVLCQFVGEVIAQGAGLPVPGPVIGLVLLLALLMLRGGPDDDLKATSAGLLRHLSLLFVPAGVGVMTQLGVLGRNWLPVAAAILLSTAIGLAVTGWVMQRLLGDEAP
jgi:holin-like protein